MAAIPVWLRGRNVTTFTLVPQTVAANGTLTPGFSESLAGVWEEIDITVDTQTEEISPADATRQNNVVIKDGYTFRCTGILKANGANQPAAILAANDVFQMNVTRGGQAWSGYFVRSNYRETIRAGRSTWEVTLLFTDTGAISYT